MLCVFTNYKIIENIDFCNNKNVFNFILYSHSQLITGARDPDLVYNYLIWSMIQRGSDTSFTNLWSLLLYLQSLLHYIENAQENKKNTILSYNIAENSKRVKWNEEKVCVCVFGCWMVFGYYIKRLEIV